MGARQHIEPAEAIGCALSALRKSQHAHLADAAQVRHLAGSRPGFVSVELVSGANLVTVGVFSRFAAVSRVSALPVLPGQPSDYPERAVDYEDPVCRCGALFCDDCRGSARRAS